MGQTPRHGERKGDHPVQIPLRLPQGADDKPEIIPEEAEVVRWIYERYLAGASTRMLRDELHEQGVTYSEKSPQWTLPHIKSILRNEKYCGDVLMQKTFQQDVINRKVIKNTGQLPMYLIENHHEGHRQPREVQRGAGGDGAAQGGKKPL